MSRWLELRYSEPDLNNTEIAQRLGISRSQLQKVLYNATKEGWLTFDDPIQRIEYEIIPKVLDNLHHYLDKKDRTVTIETAKGTVFRQFQESKGISESPQTVLALKIETAPVENTPAVIEGKVVGRARISPEE